MIRADWILSATLTAFLGATSGCGPEPAAHAEAPPVAIDQPASTPPQSLPSQSTPQPHKWAPSVAIRDWEFIVLHHTATVEGDVATIHKEHQKRRDSSGAAWRGIGYHFLIGNGKGMPDGTVEPTFRWTEQSDGAHAGSLRHNQRGIGICLVGNFNKSAPTKKQLESVKELLTWLQQEAGIPDKRVIRHSDIKATACPGKNFRLP